MITGAKNLYEKSKKLKWTVACLGSPPLCIHPSQFIPCYSMWPKPCLTMCYCTWLKKFAKKAQTVLCSLLSALCVDVLAEG